jgi:integrase
MEAYLNGHATTIRSEGQALRAAALVVDYLKAVKQISAPLSFWTPSRQLDFAGWLHRTHQHGAATIERVINVLGAAMNDAAAVKMRLDAIGQPVEGAIVSHVPKIVYQGERIAKELKLPPPKKGGYVPTMVEMATFIDSLETPHLRRWVILALNTWARPEAITDFTPETQYDRRTGAIDLNPPDRVQNDKRRPTIPITRGLADWIDHWQEEDLARFEQRYGRRPNEEIPLLVYKLKRIGTVKKAVKRIADEAGVPELTQYSTRRFMATMVRKLCPLVTRERRSMWLGHVVEEGSATTEHYEGFAVEALEEVAIATDFVISELQKLTKTKLFAIEIRLKAAELRRIGANLQSKKMLLNNGLNGGRHRVRTCDPSRVKGVLYR